MRVLKEISTDPSSIEQPSGKASKIFIVAILLGSFGPYIVGSIRTEQAIIYGALLVSLPALIRKFNPQGGLPILLPWVFYILVAFVGTVFPPLAMPHAAGNMLAGLDNLVLPLAVMLLVWSFVPQENALYLLRLVCKILALAIAINGAIAIFSSIVDLTFLLQRFWVPGSAGGSVASNALQMGRYSGIFNQPVEAGTLYSLAGLAAIYVWKSRPLFVIFLLFPIVVGGLISVSKIFVLGGMPLIIFYLCWTFRGSRGALAFGGIGLSIFVAVQSGFFSNWTGFSYLTRLFTIDPDQTFLQQYTAGRFNEGSTLSETMADVLQTSPLGGVGLAGWRVPYDSALTEFFIHGGILGLFCLLLVFLGLVSLVFSLRDYPDLILFYLLVLAVIIIGSAGFSPLTANRTSTITWLLITLFVVVSRSSRRGQSLTP